MARVLVLYATREGQTEQIAQRLAGALRSFGNEVRLCRWHERLELPDCGALILGASVHYGRHPKALAAWIRGHLGRLRNLPTAFFSVSLTSNPRYGERFLRSSGWAPQMSASFQGALVYSVYPPWKRAVVRAFAAMGGHDTDPSRDYDYTDYAAVAEFAGRFARALGEASSVRA